MRRSTLALVPVLFSLLALGCDDATDEALEANDAVDAPSEPGETTELEASRQAQPAGQPSSKLPKVGASKDEIMDSFGSRTTPDFGSLGGGVPVSEIGEACEDAQQLTTALGTTHVSGSLTNAGHDHFISCVNDFEGPDQVFRFDVPEGGATVKFHLYVDGGIDPAMAIYGTECGVEHFETDYCISNIEYVDPTMALNEGTYFVLVAGQTWAEGDFDLSITMTAAACGDGVVNAGEACDTGGIPDDGCIDPGQPGACTFEVAESTFDLCDGEATPVPAGVSALLASDGAGHSTAGYSDNYESNVCGYYNAPERVHRIVPTVSGSLTVQIGLDENGAQIACPSPGNPFCWNYVLYGRTTCEEPATEIDCADASADGYETLVFPSVTAGEPIFLFVDGYGCDSETCDSSSYGPYNLRFTLTAN